MTKYARDEFDRVPETSARQGVHRTVAESRHRRRLGPILGAGAAALAIGLVAFIFLPKIGFSSAADSTQAAAGQSGSSAAASAAPATSSEAPSSPSSPPASESPAATPAATTSAAAIDKTQPVAIFNGTATAGLANRVGGTVTTAGWTVGALGNWGGLPQQRSVVFYNGVGQKDNAEALGQLLGIPSVVDSAEFQLPLVVVLAPGFA
ncbi:MULTISPECIES: LytR C-terminal domain-containing protein [Micrococcaceae]|uniref:LytR C-terminal domain-containing protein n=1 Tax=Micrococcaceae TaxID=1268 RepID=UPI00209806E7|nr:MULTISPECIES: LytR C-terminal domain-containing protein [Micrococcaceae]MDD1475626.1 LytR C-terminal domain-containing protein [Arthrobacter sp. H16F315]MDJ0353317.1 LytR C-terminal domain-containing protein [Pseudarthrobacter sp. PH31-O2]